MVWHIAHAIFLMVHDWEFHENHGHLDLETCQTPWLTPAGDCVFKRGFTPIVDTPKTRLFHGKSENEIDDLAVALF
jgi:hypothetical protein